MKLRVESVYGFYHGQDPRTFSPDGGQAGFGLGVYRVVVTQNGYYIRDATYEDCLRDGEWEEAVTGWYNPPEDEADAQT